MVLRLFKRKNLNSEITSNPEAIFNPSIPISEIKLFGIRLNDKASLIALVKISTTTFEQPPSEAVTFSSGIPCLTWRDNKVFYDSANGEKEYLLADRINSVNESGGIFHMQSGAKYVIKDNLVIGFGIYGDCLIPYERINKNSIQIKFGKADTINESYEEVDGTLFYTEYYYKHRQIKITYSDWDKKINIINIGSFPYGNPENQR